MGRKLPFYYLVFGIFISSMIHLGDSACSIDNPFFVINKPEDLPEGTVLGVVPITGMVTSHNLTLVAPFPPLPFIFNDTTKELILSQKLDFETAATYRGTLKIFCSDGNDAQGTMIFTVNDVNDNPPKWSQQVYQGNISEGAQINDPVAFPTSGEPIYTDRDSDSFLRGNVTVLEGPNSDYFKVQNRYSKKVILQLLKNAPDYDFINEFNLTLQVQDESFFYVTCTVIIKVIDTDNKPPVFEHSSYTGVAFSNATKGHIVPISPSSIRAYDGDRAINTTIVYDIQLQPVGRYFEIDRNTGEVRINVSSPEPTAYVLLVKASQVDDPEKTATVVVTVQIASASAPPPRFTQSQYVASINENAEATHRIIEVNAGAKTDIIYAVETHTDLFHITGDNWVTLKEARLDYESGITLYNLTVTAKRVPYTATAFVIITVLDINDKKPRFAQNSYAFSVERKKGSVIGTVKATDVEARTNITYTMTPHQKFFYIDTISGDISIIADPDQLTDSKYAMVVTANDNGFPTSLSQYVSVEITFPAMGAATASFGTVPIIILAVILVVVLIILIAIFIWYRKRRTKSGKNPAPSQYGESQYSYTDHWATTLQANPVEGYANGGFHENRLYMDDIYRGDRDVSEIQLSDIYAGGHAPSVGQNGSIGTLSGGSTIAGSRQTLMSTNPSTFTPKKNIGANGVEILRAQSATEAGSMMGGDAAGKSDLTVYY